MHDIHINDVTIPAAAVLAEAQHHPARDPESAAAAAAEALAVRELLLQEARRQKLVAEPESEGGGRRETEEEALIRTLLAENVTVPEADSTTCRRYYENNRHRFRSPDLFEAAHILIAASPDDRLAYEAAVQQAERLIAVLQAEPGAFGRLAGEYSACSSAQNEGRLGQVARGDTVEEFETFLLALEEGQLCTVPIRSRYGVHVMRLDRRIEGRQLPFEAVEKRIADYLQTASWHRAVAQYVRVLAGQAKITGIVLAASDSPLVQ